MAPKFKVGESVEACFTEDNVWYKAVVAAVQPSGKFSVRYTEYGNGEDLTADRIRTLPSQGAPVPMAVPVTAVSGPAPVSLPPARSASKWKAGDLVEAKFSEDGVWYPATVSEVRPDGQYAVLYTEYGNSELVSEDSIRPAPGRAQSNGVPAQAAAPVKKNINPPPGFSQPVAHPPPQATWTGAGAQRTVPLPGTIGSQQPRNYGNQGGWGRVPQQQQPQQQPFQQQGYQGFPPSHPQQGRAPGGAGSFPNNGGGARGWY